LRAVRAKELRRLAYRGGDFRKREYYYTRNRYGKFIPTIVADPLRQLYQRLKKETKYGR
jgi:hypothetical protein